MDKHTFVPTKQAADPAPEICKSRLEELEEDAWWWRMRRWSVEVGGFGRRWLVGGGEIVGLLRWAQRRNERRNAYSTHPHPELPRIRCGVRREVVQMSAPGQVVIRGRVVGNFGGGLEDCARDLVGDALVRVDASGDLWWRAHATRKFGSWLDRQALLDRSLGIFIRSSKSCNHASWTFPCDGCTFFWPCRR